MSVLLFFSVILVRTFFAMARSALVNMRRARLLDLEQRGHASAHAIQQLTENSSRLLATAEVGALMGAVFASGVAAIFFVPETRQKLTAWFPALNDAAPGYLFLDVLAYSIVMFIAGVAIFVLGRLVPEAIAVRQSERIALLIIRPMQVFSVLLSPVVRLTIILSNLLSIPLGGQKRESTQLVTEAEIKTLVDAGEEEGLIEIDEKAMILSVLDFGDTVAREVMVPRIDIMALSADTPWDETVDYIISSGHSRVPVYRETIDDIIGILYAKDVLKAMHDGHPGPLERIVRKVYFTPESKRVSELLQELQKTRVHVSIVVDEYGGTAGLLTIEDILEEIVGEIQDEYDTEEPEYTSLPAGEGYIIDGGMNIGDANELLHIKLPEEASDTVGGFIYDQLGHVPVLGEIVRYGGIIAEVLAVTDRRILKVKITYEQQQQAHEQDKLHQERLKHEKNSAETQAESTSSPTTNESQSPQLAQ